MHYEASGKIPLWHSVRMTQDQSGMIWFATWNGLCRYDGYKFVTFKSHPGDGSNVSSDRVRDIQLGRDGNLYCKIENSFYRFNISTYKYEKLDIKSLNSIPLIKRNVNREKYSSYASDIQQAYVDHQNNIWLLGHYTITKLVTTRPPAHFVDAISRKTVRCMQRDAKGRIWICTKEDKQVAILSANGQLMGYLANDGSLHKTPVAFSSIYCMAQGKDNTIWLGSKPDGLFRLKEKSGVFTIEHITSPSLTNNNIYDLKIDRLNHLWVGTQGGGIYVTTNPTTTKPLFHSFADKIKVYGNDALKTRRLFLSHDDNLLAATTGGLLVLCNISNSNINKITVNCHMREATRANSLSSSATRNIVEIEGTYYISTETGGINRLQTTDLTTPTFNFEHIDESNEPGSQILNCIATFGNNIIAVGIDNVCLINPNTHIIRNFNRHFWCDKFRFSDAEPLRLNNGNWLFSLESGVIAVNEHEFNNKAYTPHITISSVRVEEEPEHYNCDAHDTITLNSNERNVTLSFAALDFCAEEPLLYQTRLDDASWSIATEDHELQLLSLSPGTYTLQIRSTNAQGIWANNIRTLTIIVKPHWFETIWAMIMYLLIGIIVVSGVTYLFLYIRTINRQRRETLEAYLALLDIVNHKPEDEYKSDAASNISASLPEKIASPEDDAFMAKLLHFVEQNMSNGSVGVDDMADCMAMSRSSLTRKMKSLIGVTPSDFLKEARLKHASQLLKTSDRTISDIAYTCGFSDAKYFAKCFKALTGYSPKDYRLTE